VAHDPIGLLAALAGVAVFIVAAHVLIAQTADVGVNPFQPYRDDPWPLGVQEDDDFRFAWTAEAVAANRRDGNAASEPGPDDAVPATPDWYEPADSAPNVPIVTSRIDHVHVRPAHRTARSRR
jgi:hypothetical protein